MSLSGLPPELLEAIARQLPRKHNVNALARTSRPFYHLLNGHLYRVDNAHQRSGQNLALEWAAEHGRIETILRAEALGIDIRAPDLISRAASFGTMNVVEFLLKRVPSKGVPPDLGDPSALMLAISNGHLDVAWFLIEKGADLGPMNSYGTTPLHTVAHGGGLATAELLLKHGADVDAVDTEQVTPLHLACQGAAVDVAELLIEFGADVSSREAEGSTPLHVAANHGHLGVAQMLLRRGADSHPRDDAGWTPLLMAVESRHPEVAKMLIENGGDEIDQWQ